MVLILILWICLSIFMNIWFMLGRCYDLGLYENVIEIIDMR